MPSWKKIITSGSSPNFSQITVDNTVTATAFSGIFQGALSGSAQIATQISGAFTSTSSSLAGRIKIAESELGNTLISGSAQIATAISGAFTSTSSSLASRVATNEGYLNQSVKTDASPTFVGLTTTGDVTVQGTLTAETYIVSSSVTYMTSSFSSGSTIFGDDSADSHKFTGSLLVTGSFKVDSGNAEFAGNISGSSTSTGSFGHIIKGGVNWDTAVSSSAAAAGFGTGGGGSFTAAGISGSLGTNATLIRGLTNARISGSFTDASSSLASRITTAELELGNTLISGSAQIKTEISGAFGNQRVGTTDNVVFNKIITTGPDVFGGNVTVTGNLTLVGTQSLAAKLTVEDQFGFFASGSEDTNLDAGIMVQSGSSANTGSVLYHDVHPVANVNPQGGRWSVAKGFLVDDTAVTPLEYVVTVKSSGDTDDPDSTDVNYGVGEMYINNDGEIFIYTGN